MTAIAATATARTRAALAPFVVARVAGMHASALDPLRLSATRRAVDDVLALDEMLAELGGPLEQALHDTVPHLVYAAARRAALKLRRDVHNGRSPGGRTRREIAGVAVALPVGSRVLLHRWLQACDARATISSRAESLARTELHEAGRHLVRHLRRPEIHLALAAVTPAFAAELLRQEEASVPDSRFARSCTAYLARTAVKTSPLSSLTTVRVHTPGDGERSGPARRMTINRMLVLELLLAAANDPQLARSLDFRVAPAVRPESIVVVRYAAVGNYPWRDERPVAASACGPVTRLATQLPEGSFNDYAQALGGECRAARLVASGLLRPVSPSGPMSRTPLADLAGTIDTLGTAQGRQFAAAVRELDGALAQAASPELGDRIAAVRSLPQHAARAIAVTGRPAPAWLHDVPLVHENVCTPAPPLPGPVAPDVDVLADAVRRTIVRTSLYDDLVRHFVELFGRNGTCLDVTSFLFGLMEHPDARRRIGACTRRDAVELRRTATRELVVGPGMLPPTASVMYQVSGGAEAVQTGRHLIVLNHCVNGVGGLVSRFLTIAGCSASLRTWIQSLVPHALPVEVSVAADCNGLQDSGGVLPFLRWPADLPSRSGQEAPIELDELIMRHDAPTNTLFLNSRHGMPVVPVYLGTTPQHLVGGPLRLLLTLGDPWLVGLRPGLERRLFDAPLQVPDGVEHAPRTQAGRVVLQRASWRVRADDLPLPDPGETVSGHLRRVERWRRERGLPHEVFVSVQRRATSTSRDDHKPLWLAFDSPHALAVAARQIGKDADALCFVEALPGRGDLCPAEPDGKPLATEYVSLFAWPADAP